jgi:uncharacterized protein YjbI with pentapeptide repeats
VGRFGRCCASAFAVVVSAAAPALAAPVTRATVHSEAIARDLRAGHPVVREGVFVKGALDLRAADTVRAVFKCRQCTFEGRIFASDVTFAKTVDLSGSTFTRSVDFRGATFDGPALFRTALSDRDGGGADRRAVFAGRVDFSLAFFREFSSFSGAAFNATAAFRDARFTDASFASAIFGSAAFDRATFRGAALFNDAKFGGPATFTDADFRKRADFALARFESGGVFKRVQFGDNASFLGATLSTPEPCPRSPGADSRPSARAMCSDSYEAGRFDDVAAAGNLDFTFVRFEIRGDSGRYSSTLAVFSDLVCGGSLVFRQATFAKGRVIRMQRLQARDLVLDVSIVPQISGDDDQRNVLQMIEDSGKARGDLQAANDAHYALRAERSNDYSTVGRVLDYVFYRGVAGYFVRPLRPILVLLIGIGLLSLVSVVRARRPGEAEQTLAVPTWRRIWSGTTTRCSEFLTCFFDKVGLVRPQRSEGPDSPPLGRRLESFAYRLLVVCAILGLANSNPTLRQMVETLF